MTITQTALGVLNGIGREQVELPEGPSIRDSPVEKIDVHYRGARPDGMPAAPHVPLPQYYLPNSQNHSDAQLLISTICVIFSICKGNRPLAFSKCVPRVMPSKPFDPLPVEADETAFSGRSFLHWCFSFIFTLGNPIVTAPESSRVRALLLGVNLYMP